MDYETAESLPEPEAEWLPNREQPAPIPSEPAPMLWGAWVVLMTGLRQSMSCQRGSACSPVCSMCGRLATAVLIRPDGYVAWVGEGSQLGLADALTAWFGPPSVA